MMRFFFKPPGPRFIDHCQWLLLMVANLYSSDPMFAINRSSLITEDLQGKANLIKSNALESESLEFSIFAI